MSECCGKKVSDRTGYHFWPCGKTAKFLVKTEWQSLYRCGIHARRYKRDLQYPERGVISVERIA